MSIRIGEEFRIAGTPGQDWWREHGYLRTVDNDSILTPGTADDGGGSSRRVAAADGAFEMMQMLDQQQMRAARIADLNNRIDELDHRIADGLRGAEDHLAAIRRTANRATDGRSIFRDEDDGKIYDEYGNEVLDDEVDWATWNDDNWTRQQFDGALEDRGRWIEAQEKVDEARDGIGRSVTDEELAAISDDLRALEADIDGYEGSPSPFSSPRSDSAAIRPTSAAKIYDEAGNGGAGINTLFHVASNPADPVPAEEPAPEIEPGEKFTPR